MSHSLEREALSGPVSNDALAQAQSLIENIRLDHGYIKEKIWQKLDAETKEAVQDAMCKKDNLIASSVST